MLQLRNHSKGARFASFGVGLCVFALMPAEIGYQDIASLLARQPGVAERWQKRVFSAASTIQVATYDFGRPIGTSIPQTVTYRLASLDTQGVGITGSVTRNPIMLAPPRYQASDFPKVDRTLKGDRLAILPPQPAAPANAAPSNEDPSTSNASVRGAKTAAAPSVERSPLDPELQEALSAPPLAQYDVAMSLEAQPLDDLKAGPDAAAIPLEPAPSRDGFSVRTASLFFASTSLGGSVGVVARCEAVRGEIAVAQVVLNRAFSRFYPSSGCGVVYQNKPRHLACQFTFGCDRVADVVREPDMWARARKIANAMLDGRLWLPEVAKSTHYHAYWVRPSWVNEMKKMYKFGVHTFYRPRAWGDGSEPPRWGTPAETAAISAKLAEAAHSSAEMSESSVRR